MKGLSHELSHTTFYGNNFFLEPAVWSAVSLKEELFDESFFGYL